MFVTGDHFKLPELDLFVGATSDSTEALRMDHTTPNGACMSLQRLDGYAGRHIKRVQGTVLAANHYVAVAR